MQPPHIVERNQPLVELDTTKASLELPSPQAGRIVRTVGEPGDVIEVGSTLVVFEVDDDTAGIVGSVPKEKNKTHFGYFSIFEKPKNRHFRHTK